MAWWILCRWGLWSAYVYYSYFDSAVIEHGELDIHEGEVVGFVASSASDYFAPVAFPDRIEIGLRVDELAIFREGEEDARSGREPAQCAPNPKHPASRPENHQKRLIMDP